jgi:tight adherence protein B
MSKIATKKLSIILAGMIFAMIIFNSAVATANQNQEKHLILVIDTSGSMASKNRFNYLKKSITATVPNFNSLTVFSLFSFSTKVNQVLSREKNYKKVISAIDNLELGSDTALYDAIILAIKKAKEKSLNEMTQILVITDGRDTSSNTSFDKTVQIINQSRVKINILGLQTSQDDSNKLQTLVDWSGGVFVRNAKIEDMAADFLNFQTISTPEKKVQVNLNQRNQISPFALFTSLIVGCISFIFARSLFQRIRRIRRIAWYKEALSSNKNQFRKIQLDGINSYIARKILSNIPKKSLNYLSKLIHKSNLDIQINKVVIWIFYASILLWISLLLLGINVIVAIFLSSIFVYLAVISFFKITISRMQKEISIDISTFVNLLANAMRSGLSFDQGLDAYATSSNNGLSRQIKRVLMEVRVGTSMAEALDALALRLENVDFSWVVNAYTIQRQVGGSLVSVLDNVSETLNQRLELRREIRTLSAEGKFSGLVLMALPISIFLFLFVTNRTYVSFFWTTFTGLFFLGVIFMLLAIGWLWIGKLIRINV